MSAADRVEDLLLHWEESRERGEFLSPETLCRECPALLAEVRDKVRILEAMYEVPNGVGPDVRTSPAVRHEIVTDAAVHRVDGYDLLEVVGRGGMGVVYKARQVNLDRPVALKMILAGADAGASELARFQTEAEAVARLEHPNIIQIYEVGNHAGRPYLVLEWADGGNLAQLLDGTPLSGRDAAALLLPLARAAAYAHARGVVHRDLKPANILLRKPEGESRGDGPPPPLVPKIADFGLAKRLDLDEGNTQTGAVLGTPSYMAPEQAAGRAEAVGPATDVHALGTILYELLTGRRPFIGTTVMQTLDRVREQEPVPPRLLQPAVAHDLEVICLKCLQKAPADRYTGAAALAADLQAYLDDEPIRARPSTALEQLARAIRHHNLDERIGPASTSLFLMAPWCVLSHLAAYWFWHASPRFPQVITLTSTLAIIFLPVGFMAAQRPILRILTRQQRRRMWNVWGANAVTSFLAVVLFWLTTPAHDPERLLFVYPVLILLVAKAYFAVADDLGIYYVIGGVCCGLAVLTAFVPFWSALIVSFLAGGNMLAQALFFRAMGKAAGRVRNPPSGSRLLIR
jgi:serine/threonine protein kinase